MKLLWLDDMRNPYIDVEGKVPANYDKIEWVLNYEQFVQWIIRFGLPNAISFDHDLADEHYVPEEYWETLQKSREYQEAQNYQEKTGMDCVKWLVEYCMDNNYKLPIYHIHTANPVGAENMKGLLDNFKKNEKRK